MEKTKKNKSTKEFEVPLRMNENCFDEKGSVWKFLEVLKWGREKKEEKCRILFDKMCFLEKFCWCFIGGFYWKIMGKFPIEKI